MRAQVTAEMSAWVFEMPYRKCLNVVVDGKSRPLVRMFITRSTRSQAPRRRRRPKNAVNPGSSLTTASSSSVAAAASMASYRVDDLKHEPSSAEVCHLGPIGLCYLDV